MSASHRSVTPRSLAAVAAWLLVGFAAWSPTAGANTYTVFACDRSVGGGANNSFASVADNGMTSYTDCPAGQGMTVRNVYDNGQSGAFTGAYMVFDAPPGNTVESVSFDPGLERHDCRWALGLIASGGDFGGTPVWQLPPNQQCDSWSSPGSTNFFPFRLAYAINAPRARFEARCGAAMCPRNGVSVLRVRNVHVVVRDESPPALVRGRGGLWTSQRWLSGTQTAGFDAEDASGVSSLSVAVDGREVAKRTQGCDATRRAPCPNGGLDESFATAGFGDGTHTVALRASDAAGNASEVATSIRVDNTAPGAPGDLTVEGGSAWRATNDFTLAWKLAADAGSPVAGARWELCPTNGGPCVRGAQDGETLSSLKGFAVPSAGEWKMKLWLRDEAGNEDQRLASTTVLRFDGTAPTIELKPQDPADPTLMTAVTTDEGSGVVAGAIELRRVGAQQWTALPTEVKPGALTARLDDVSLADGDYEILARGSDAAGNERSTQSLAGGAKATLTLPLRLKTRLAGGIVRRRGKRVVLARSAVVPLGRLVRVRGRLLTPEGNPVQDADVQVHSQVRDGATAPRLLATMKTSRTGRFSVLVRKGPSRLVRMSYAGTALVRGATKDVVLNVRSRSTMRPNRRRLANGETVRFVGRVATGRLPATGKLVELQVVVRKRWRTFATTRASRRGGWRYDYRFDGTRGSQTYRFRARIPLEAGYPYVTGRSPVVRVRVRGA